MTVAHPPEKLSWNDYRLFPNDGKRHELIDGDHYMSPSPQAPHQKTVTRLFYLLSNFVYRHKLGELFVAPFDIIFSEFDVLEPDLIFVSSRRLREIVKDWIRGAPDLVIEVISPSTEETDRTLKFKLYERYGVREYWLVSPEDRTIEIFVLGEAGYNLIVQASGNMRVKSKILARLNFAARRAFE